MPPPSVSRTKLDEAAFLALVALLPVMQPFSLQLGSYPIPLADILFLALAPAFLFMLVSGRRRLRIGGWEWAVAAYGLATAAAAFAAEDRRTSLIKLAGVVYLCGLGILTTQYVNSIAMLRRTLTAWLVGTALTGAAVAAGVVLFYLGVTGSSNIFLYSFGSLPPGAYPRVMGLFLNANMLATYVIASVFVILGMRRAGWVSARLGGVLMAGALLASVLSLSPAIGGLVLGLCLWYARELRDHRGLAGMLRGAGWGAAIMFVVAVTVSPAALVERSADGEWTPRFEPSSRLQTWSGAWQTFRSHPWLGVGPGVDVTLVRYVNASGGVEQLTDAHNTGLSILAQQGIAGGITFLVLTAGLLWPLTRAGSFAARKRGLFLALAYAFAFGVLYPSLSGSFEDTRHIWVLMGLLAVAPNLPDEERG
jgi:O-antigen ligase